MADYPPSQEHRAQTSTSDAAISDANTDALGGILRFLLLALLIGFLAGLWFVLRPFIVPLVWSVVITTATWPAYKRLRRVCPKHRSSAPLISTIILASIFLLVALPLPIRITSELRDLGKRLEHIDMAQVQSSLKEVPVLGSRLADAIFPLITESRSLATLFEAHPAQVLSFAGSAARGMLVTAAHLIATLAGCYIFYQYGEILLDQLKNVLRKVGGEKIPLMLEAVEPTVRGAAYGVIATAAAQGTLAALGYYVAGAPIPLLLGAVTGIVALIPFGPPLVYLPVAAYLSLFTSLPWFHAVGLALWGTLVVSGVDNFLRPLFISQATSGSPILLFIGVLGGVLSFGLLGVFAGPAIIAVAQLLWRDLACSSEVHIRPQEPGSL